MTPSSPRRRQRQQQGGGRRRRLLGLPSSSAISVVVRLAATTTTLLLLLSVRCSPADAFAPPSDSTAAAHRAAVLSRGPASSACGGAALRMGLLDNVLSRFRGDSSGDGDDDDDEGDFVRLSDMSDRFAGPGPVVLLYQAPDGIDDEEVRDMLADGAPTATAKGISLARIASMADGDPNPRMTDNRNLVDLSLGEALESVIAKPPEPYVLAAGIPRVGYSRPPTMEGSPVAIFSGFANAEMMESYNILGEELYKETSSVYGKGQFLACARAVPNAMGKPLRQVLTEISGDHEDAMSSRGPPSSSPPPPPPPGA